MQNYKWGELLISGLTAFIIAGGGAIVVVTGSGYQLNNSSWLLAAVVGAVSAAKDIRSQMKLPPVEPQSPPVGGRT